MYSLWRDGVRLADIVERGPLTGDGDEVVGFTGVLDLEARPGLAGVRQMCVTSRPGMPVIQLPLDPIDMGAIWNAAAGRGTGAGRLSGSSARVGPHGFMVEDVRVPPEAVVVVRHADGTWIAASELTLQRRDLPDGPRTEQLLRANGLPPDIRTMWEVSVTFGGPPRT
jgi:hypothetical protein